MYLHIHCYNLYYRNTHANVKQLRSEFIIIAVLFACAIMRTNKRACMHACIKLINDVHK